MRFGEGNPDAEIRILLGDGQGHFRNHVVARGFGVHEGRLVDIVPCGEGMIDWTALLQAAMKSDIADHGFIVEIETEEPLEGLKRSINFLKTVEV